MTKKITLNIKQVFDLALQNQNEKNFNEAKKLYKKLIGIEPRLIEAQYNLGVIYEEVDEYNGKPQLFRGETGAQSSIVPALDALLGITHSNDPLREYLDEMRLYMPIEHRNILNHLDEWSESKRSSVTNQDKSVKLTNEIIKEVHTFRNKHLEYARTYIHEQSLSNQNNSNVVGTGGTPFMKYLDKHLQETVPTND